MSSRPRRLFFSKMAAVTFGGAYAVLSYVAQQAVDIHHWLQPDEMLAGLGLAETTPGPLILVLVFVGFLGGARHSGLDPLAGGIAGALVTLWFTFVPCFLWIFAGAPYVETVRSVRWLATALAAVTAAVVGIIANLALWFALHVLFGAVGETAVGPLTIPVPDLSTFDLAAAIIALAAGVALIRFKANLFAVLAAAMAAGDSASEGFERQSNRLDTDSSVAVREIASPIRSAIEMTRMFSAASTLDEGWIELVITSSLSLEPAILATAPPDSTPWVM